MIFFICSKIMCENKEYHGRKYKNFEEYYKANRERWKEQHAKKKEFYKKVK